MKHVLRSQRKRAVLEALGVLVLTPVVAFGWLWWIDTPLRFLSVDLYPTYVAGSLWFQGHWDAIYQRDVFFDSFSGHPRWLEEVKRLGANNFGSSFVYSPVYLWLMLPVIASVTLSQFIGLFVLLNAVSAVVIGSEALRLAGVERLSWRLAGGVAAAFSFPAIYGAGLGQNVLPAGALLLLGVRALESRPRGQPLGVKTLGVENLGVALLLGAIAFKTWIVAVLPLFLLAGWWRPFLGAVLGYLAFFVLLPRQVAPGFSAMYQETAARLPGMSVVAHNNVSLRATLHRAAWPEWGADISRWYPTAAPRGVQLAEWGLLAVLGLGFLALWWRRRPEPPILLAAGLALLIPCLGISWSHYLVLLIPAVAVGLLDPRLAWPSRVLSGLLLVLLFFPIHPLAMRPLPTPDMIAGAPTLWMVYYAVPPVLTIAVAFVLMLDPHRDTQARSRRVERAAEALET